MQLSCHFQSRSSTACSFERRDQTKNTEIVPIRACCKDISPHKSLWAFSGVDTETDLILARAGIFKPDEHYKLNEIGTICPHHRSELGLGWRWNSNKCAVPPELSNHGKRKAEWGISKQASEEILKKTGILVPVGSGNILLTKQSSTYLLQNVCGCGLKGLVNNEWHTRFLTHGLTWITVNARIIH